MDVHSHEKSEPLRYERKYLIRDYSYADVLQIIRFHPAAFTEIFHQRTVNNIYFDTLGLNNYYENVEGYSSRNKIRIRWYGDLFGNIQSPVLEFKVKQGLLGYKRAFKINPFVLDGTFSKVYIDKVIRSSALPLEVEKELLSVGPVLLNQYKRRYFLSKDKAFRLTVDHDLVYYGVRNTANSFLNKSEDKGSVVLEMKYDHELELQAKEVGNGFPFMVTKNSKYLNGLERILL